MSLDHDAIRARADAATEGPWTITPPSRQGLDWLDYYSVGTKQDGYLERATLDVSSHLNAEADADFIAHARTDIPALLDENARLRAALDAAKGCGSVITEEAVEAAVKAWDHYWGDRYGDEALEEMGDEVRVALEAAAPFLTQEAAE